mmetsp:Transcript_54113/g.168040  ORF Transcript_54113/g.168040 Transcript_54113/m.168040 type:complete len:456 (+) Transcript_54113:52-1419(+)
MPTEALRRLDADLASERRTLLQLQRQARRASQAALLAQRRLRVAERTAKLAKERVTVLLGKGWVTVRAEQTLKRCKGNLSEATKQRAASQRDLRQARQRRQAQAKRVQKTVLKRERQQQLTKVAALQARHSRVLKLAVQRERQRQALLEQRQQKEFRALQLSQTAALKSLRERQSTTMGGLRRRSGEKLKQLRSKQQSSVAAYRRWLASEESRHADQFKRCVGGSLGSSLCVLRPKTGRHQCTLVYLHQFNCEGFGYAYFRPHYFYSSTKFRFNGLKIVLPTASRIPITAHEQEEKHAWYDYKTDYNGIREDAVNMASLRKTRDRVFQILEREIQLVGGDASKVFIGGASQGCCTALHCAMQFPRVLGGFVGIVGHLLSCTPVPPSKRQMPVCLYNGRADTMMRWSWVRKTFRRFEAAGFADLSIRCEPGVGHDTGTKEREWLIDFLSKYVPQGA